MSEACQKCGLCCRLFPVPLTEKEYRSGKYRTFFGQDNFSNDFREVLTCGANLLKQREDGSCVYLIDNKCSIHPTRPQVCRGFFCTSKLKKYKKMIEAVKKKRALMASGK